MISFDGALTCSVRAHVFIERLAEALNCSPEAFSDQAPHELSQTLELLSLWLAIDAGQDRAKALTLLRSMQANKQTMDVAGALTPGEVIALAHAKLAK